MKNRIYGLTLDNPWDAESIVNTLKKLTNPIWLRVVFDEDCRASEYEEILAILKPHVAGIMGQLLDSYFVKDISLENYKRRTRDYWARLHKFVDVWEVGNEVNGDWLGREPWQKFEAAHKYIKDQGGKTAITLYMGEPAKTPSDLEYDWELFSFSRLVEPLRESIDWVLMSSYPHDNNGYEGDWNDTINNMGLYFPNAEIGIGECGKDPDPKREPKPFPPAERIECFRHYYREIDAKITHPKFIGGYFHWYQQDFFGKKPALLGELNEVIK